MKLLRLLSLIAILIMLSVNANASSDIIQVKKLFQEYSQDLLKDNYDVAWHSLSKSSQAHFYKVVNYSATLSDSELRNIDAATILMIISVRHDYKKHEISKLTGKDIFKYLMTTTKKDNIQKLINDISFIKVNKVYYGIYDKSRYMMFIKENNKWKVDFNHTVSIQNKMYDELAKKHNTNAYTVVRTYVENNYGSDYDKRTWLGPIE